MRYVHTTTQYRYGVKYYLNKEHISFICIKFLTKQQWMLEILSIIPTEKTYNSWCVASIVGCNAQKHI